MSGMLESVSCMELREGKNRRSVETLGAAAREASGSVRLAIDAEQWNRRTRWRRPPRRLRNRRIQHRLEATEGQTAGLAIDSELEVFKPWRLDGGIKVGMSSCGLRSKETRAVTPNDPKLSDCGARRGSCVVRRSEDIRARERVARTRRVELEIAATVTRGAVRCSAWLGVSGLFGVGGIKLIESDE